jgi:hypothetical protein
MGGTRRATPARPQQRREAPTACVRRVVEEACNCGNLAALDAVLPLPSSSDPAAADGWAGPQLRDTLAEFREAVPDARWTIVEQITQGTTVVTRLAVQGTFSGPLLGLAPPGRPATLTGVAISRFARGRLTELGLLRQLGVLPPLDLARTVAMAQVARAGARLARSELRASSEEAGNDRPPGARTAPRPCPMPTPDGTPG